jgi:hypothetical protein
LYFYNARYYDPSLGRFLQADTIVPNPANPQSLNRYSYVLNSPLRYTDPSGHEYDERWSGGGGGYGGAVGSSWQRDLNTYFNYEYLGGQQQAAALDYESKIAAIGTYNPQSYPPNASGGENLPADANADVDDEVLYRGMKEAEDGLPVLRNSSSGLGVRPSDITVDADGFVAPSASNPQGMSVSPGNPENLPPSMRPPEFGGTGRNVAVWSIQKCDLGTDLTYFSDLESPTTHGFVAPSYRMSYESYLTAVQELRSLWEKVIR